jgi:hypothetical protein
MSKREFFLWLTITFLFGWACFQSGFIVAKWEKFDHTGRLLRHSTQIEILKSDLKIVKEKLRIP